MRPRRARRFADCVCAIAVLLCAHGSLALANQLGSILPIPDEAAQAKAVAVIREIYEKDYRTAKTPADQTALAKKMIDQAGQTAEPVGRFVLLRVARDVASEAGDAETALAAVDQTAQSYVVDAAAMHVETLLKAAANARLPEQRKAVVECSISLIQAALADDDYETARRLVDTALASARREREMLKEVVELRKQIVEAEEAYAEVAKALAILEEKPTDPDANLAAGRYYGLVKGDWDRGIPMLALGSDEELKGAAQKELQAADSPQEQAALGNAWWDLAQTREGEEKNALLLRAGSWYEEAKAGPLAGLAQLTVGKRLEEIRQIGRAAPAPRQRDSQLLRGALLMMTFEPETFASRDGKTYVADLSDHENHGIVSGATLTPQGRAGAALQFDGRDDYVLLETLRADLTQDLKELSLAFWVLLADVEKTGYVFDVGFCGSRHVGVFCHQGQLAWELPGAHGGGVCPSKAVEVGRWHHVVAVWNGKEQNVYVDAQAGDAVPTKDLILNATSVSTEHARLGRQAKSSHRGDRYLRGLIDELAIFNRALSESEIRNLHEMGRRGQVLRRPRRARAAR